MKISQKTVDFVRQKKLMTRQEICAQLCKELELRCISEIFWAMITEDGHLEDYWNPSLDLLEKNPQLKNPQLAWNNFVNRITPQADLERRYQEAGVGHMVQRGEDADSLSTTESDQVDDKASVTFLPVSDALFNEWQNCLTEEERLRSWALHTYFIARVREIGIQWRQKYLSGKIIFFQNVSAFLGSPAMRFFSFEQIQEWGVAAHSHTSSIVSDEVVSGSIKRVVVEFSPSGVRQEAIYDTKSLIDVNAVWGGFLNAQKWDLPHTILPGSAVYNIYLVTEGIAQDFGWKPILAIISLLCGEQVHAPQCVSASGGAAPVLPNGRKGSLSIANTITLTIPYFLSEESMIRVYRLAQQKVVRQREKPRLKLLPRKDEKPNKRRAGYAIDPRTPLLFIFLEKNNLTHNRLAELPAWSRRRVAELWNDYEKFWRDFFCDAKRIQEIDGLEKAEEFVDKRLKSLRFCQTSPGAEPVINYSWRHHRVCHAMPEGTKLGSQWGQISLNAWTKSEKTWQFIDKQGQTDTRRFVEESKRAESIMLNISKEKLARSKPYLKENPILDFYEYERKGSRPEQFAIWYLS